MKIALYKGKGKIGNAIIRWWTNSQYSHCELVIGEFCYTSSFMDGGVRSKQIDLTNGNWDLIDVPWGNEERALWFFKQTKGAKYDWLGIFGSQFFNLRFEDSKKYFCNEWVGAALDIPNPEIYDPENFGTLIKYLNTRK